MKRRLLSALLVFALILGLIPNLFATSVLAEADTVPTPIVEGVCCHARKENAVSTFAARPTFRGKLIEITPQRVEDTFQYLDEMYVRKHPEAALSVYTGTEADREVLKTLAQKITAGCRTNTEKANAIDNWLRANIEYDVNTSAFASDTFYRRAGNCLSYANLMQFLLRSLGIPAVVGDGWRGNMSTNTVDLFNYEGHAWCFVLLDGEWVMYDPLWLTGGTTDREYMAKWVYFDNVEFVCPVNDSDNLPPEVLDKAKAYYCDGRTFCWSEFFLDKLGVCFNFVNNQCYTFVTNQCEPEIGGSDGWMYLYSDYDKTQMQRGEVYSDSWISYGDYTTGNAMGLTYTFPNGMTIDGAVMTLDGQDYLMYANQCLPIAADKADYWIEDGIFTLKTGYQGDFLNVPWQDNAADGMQITWDNWNPEIATVDSDGKITCHQEGFAEFMVMLIRLEQDGSQTMMGSCIMQVQVMDKQRVPSYDFIVPLGVPKVKISGVASSGQNKISWNSASGAAKYQVYRGTSKNGTYKRLITTSKLSYTDTSAKAGTKYYYYVVAVDAKGNESDISNIVVRTCDLAQPVITTKNVSSSGKIKVSWNKIDGAKEYKVYRATSKNGTYKLMKTTTGTSYTNTSAVAGKTYYYKVMAVHSNSAANSAYSGSKYRTCDLARPIVTISLNSKNKPRLVWKEISGAEKYEIYRATSKSGTYKLVKTTTSTSYTNTSAIKGKTYYYKVVAVHSKSAANSAYSLIDSITSKYCQTKGPAANRSRPPFGRLPQPACGLVSQ